MKKDYRKINIFSNGKYVASTTWSKTCKAAVRGYHNHYGYVSNEIITANFAKE